jgi:hypothetical protein
MISKSFKTWLIQKVLSHALKIGIKYGFEGFEEMNNFLNRNFFRFITDFE